jgi:sugar lactone lactonase YvrE
MTTFGSSLLDRLLRRETPDNPLRSTLKSGNASQTRASKEISCIHFFGSHKIVDRQPKTVNELYGHEVSDYLPLGMIRIVLVLLLMAHTALSQNPEAGRHVADARNAVSNKNYASAYEHLLKAHAYHPYHQGILYQLGVMSALTGKPDESISYLRKALFVNAGYKLDIEELASVKDRQDFIQLIELQKELQVVVALSDTAFVLKDRGLHIESVAVDPKTGIAYAGSVRKRKIVSVDAKGTVRDFVTTGEHGLTAVLGLRVDSKRHSLWACSSPVEEMEGYDSLLPSRVSRFDLSTGKLIAHYEAPGTTGHIFGDLTMAPTGQVFVADSRTNEIYVVNEKSGTLERFLTAADFWNIQGISCTDDGRYLFISDYVKGPYRMDMASRKVIKVNAQSENSLKGIDGLIYHNGALLALQNGTYPLRVMRFRLNGTLDTITSAEIIDQGRPVLNEPTQGTVVGNDFYYVANSQWGGYDKNHKPKPSTALQDIVILKCRLQQ